MQSSRFDLASVEAYLRAVALSGDAVTYSEALAAFGYRFTRPLMRQFCAVLNELGERGRAVDEPDLAVFVVRQSDGLPGQGWWVGRTGPWEGPEARALVRQLQATATSYWRAKRKDQA